MADIRLRRHGADVVPDALNPKVARPGIQPTPIGRESTFVLSSGLARDTLPRVDTPPPGRTLVTRDVDRLREQLMLLAVECPYTNSNPPGCPLHEVRQMEPEAVIDWLDGLSGEEKDYLTFYHECCLMTRCESDWVQGGKKRKRKAAAGGGSRKGLGTSGARSRRRAR